MQHYKLSLLAVLYVGQSSERPNPTRPMANCIGLEIVRRVLNKDCKYHVAFDDLVSSKRQFVAVDGKKSKSTGNKSPVVSVRRSTICVYNLASQI